MKIEVLFGDEPAEKTRARKALACVRRALTVEHPTAKVSIRFKPLVTIVTISDARKRDYLRLRDHVWPKINRRCKL